MTPRNHILRLLLGEFLTIALHFLLVLRQFLLTVSKWTVRIGAFSVVNNPFTHVSFVLGMFYSIPILVVVVSLIVLIWIVIRSVILRVIFLTVVFLIIVFIVTILLFLILCRPGIKIALGWYNLLDLLFWSTRGFLLLIHIVYRLLRHLGGIGCRRLVVEKRLIVWYYFLSRCFWLFPFRLDWWSNIYCFCLRVKIWRFNNLLLAHNRDLR